MMRAASGRDGGVRDVVGWLSLVDWHMRGKAHGGETIYQVGHERSVWPSGNQHDKPNQGDAATLSG